MKKFFKLITISAAVSLLNSITVFAGHWTSDNIGQRYQNDEGNYITSEWINQNGQWYYLNENGYMVVNAWLGNYYVGADGAMLTNTTTPDGYQVGADGAWIPYTAPLKVEQIYGLYECHTEYLDAELEVGVYTGDGTDYIHLVGLSHDGRGAGEFNGIVVSTKENNYTAVDEFGNVIDIYFDGSGNAEVRDGNTGLGGMYFPGFEGIYQMTADFSHVG